MQKAENVDSLLGLSGESFVRTLYATLLGREPDVQCLEGALQDLSNGLDKRDLVVTTAQSVEAQEKARPLEGLPTLLKEVRRENMPVFGGLFRLKYLVKRILQQVNQSDFRLSHVENQMSDRFAKIEHDVFGLTGRIEKSADANADMMQASAANMDSILSRLEALESALENIMPAVDRLKASSDGANSEFWLKLNHLVHGIDGLKIKNENLGLELENIRNDNSYYHMMNSKKLSVESIVVLTKYMNGR